MKKSRSGRQLFQAQKASHKTPFKSGKHPGMRRDVPLPGPNVTPEPNEKIKGLAGNLFQAHRNQATRHPSNQENTLARRDETASCRPSARAKLFQGTNQAARHPSNQEMARRDETASCPEPNEKIKGLAGNCSRHTKQATRHPSNQENTLARRDETASCRPSARAKRHS